MADELHISTQAWLAKARSDLRSAAILSTAESPLYDTAIYHCQQAAEKAVKAPWSKISPPSLLQSHHHAFIDGEPLRFESGDTLLNFIDRHKGRGFVPTLCDAPQLEPYGACRVCSVEVALQADGPRRVVASCHTPLISGHACVYTSRRKCVVCAKTSSSSCSRTIRWTA
jgi:hypothetical protein